MQVLTNAPWTKFEAAIAAVKLRGSRPRWINPEKWQNGGASALFPPTLHSPQGPKPQTRNRALQDGGFVALLCSTRRCPEASTALISSSCWRF